MIQANNRTILSFLSSFWVHALIILYLFLQVVDLNTDDKIEEEVEITLSMEPESEASEPGIPKIKKQQKGKGEGKHESFESFSGVDKDKWGSLLKRLDKSNSLRGYKQTFEDLFGSGQVADSYIYRKRRNEDMTVKDVFPTLNDIEKPFSETIKKAPRHLKNYLDRNEIIKKYRKWRKGDIAVDRVEVKIVKYPADKSHIPLKFPKDKRSKYFDSTLPLTKEKQLEMFSNNYLQYDPDKGDLPIAVRELYQDNLQRIAYQFSFDRSFFYVDYFDENLNKEDFLKHSLYQVSRLGGTKTGSELLFAIENIYEIQQRAWSFFYEFERHYKSLPAEKKDRLRNETLRRILERYKPMAAAKGIRNYRDAIAKYTKKRLEIMDHLISTSPDKYRVYDAMFMKAKILWERGYYLNEIKDLKKATGQLLNLAEITGVSKKLLENSALNPNDGSTPAASDTKVVETKKTKNKDTYNDFLNEEALMNVYPYLQQFVESEYDEKGAVKHIIKSTLENREQKRLKKKELREKKLLWP